MAMKLGDDNGDLKLTSEINITPLTDVFLVLLIIFMVTTSFLVQPGIDIKVPKVKNVEVVDIKEDIILIGIGIEQPPAGVNVPPKIIYYIEPLAKKLTFEELRGEMASRIANSKSKKVVIKADKTVPFGYPVEVFDEAKTQGALHLVIATEPKTTERTSLVR